MGETFIINRIEFRKELTSLGISERNIIIMETKLNKMHRHVNAIALAGMLQQAGVKDNDIKNVLRRAGIDDVIITNILNSLDEQKINEAFGKVVELNIE
jgi:hypothetical protein